LILTHGENGTIRLVHWISRAPLHIWLLAKTPTSCRRHKTGRSHVFLLRPQDLPDLQPRGCSEEPTRQRLRLGDLVPGPTAVGAWTQKAGRTPLAGNTTIQDSNQSHFEQSGAMGGGG
jgi:hypothetical protein